jgi:hypothetical protein
LITIYFGVNYCKLNFLPEQVDSPCPSPASLTPSTSVTNLNSLGIPDKAATATALKTLSDGSIIIPIQVEGPQEEKEEESTPMEVEQGQERAGPEGDGGGGGSSCGGGGPELLVPEAPAPHHLSDLENKVMSAALTRLCKEVEEDTAALNKALQVRPRSTELTRGLSSALLFKRGVHIGARALHVLNLIWISKIARLSQWGGGR